MKADAQSASVLLVCVSGPDSGKRLALSAAASTIGRAATCSALSDDPDAADCHVSLRLDDGKPVFIATCEAKIYLDGQTVTEGQLLPGQQLRIGRSLWQISRDGENTGGFASFFEDIGGRISEAAGVEKIEGFKLSEMFSEVWRKRTDEDMENYFAVGTPCNTPKLSEVDTSWPKPWLFFKTFVLTALVYAGFVFAYDRFHNANLIPGLLVIGSFIMPVTLLILFFEINVLRNVPLYQVLKLLFLGGVLSLVLSLFLYEWTRLGEQESWLGAFGAGIVEETGKAAALLLVLNKVKYRWILNGMLFGAAIGAGFAGFESAGYALRFGIDNITMRGLLALCGGHVLWTALVAGALWRVRADQRFQWDMLTDMRFVRVFALCVGMHMLWDSPLRLPFYLKFLALGFVAWVALLSFIQAGLKQVKAAQATGATEFFRRQRDAK